MYLENKNICNGERFKLLKSMWLIFFEKFDLIFQKI